MSSPFVLDGSVALSWCFEDEADEYADAVLGRLASETAIVPAILWQLEVYNGLLTAERRGRLSDAQVRDHMNRYSDLRVIAIPPPLDDVFDLARKHQRTSYDAAYLALALAERIPLATLDRGLRQACVEAGVPLLGQD